MAENVFGPPTGVTAYYHWGHLIQVNIPLLFTGPTVFARNADLRGIAIGDWKHDDMRILPSGAVLVGWSFVLVPPRTDAEVREAEKLGWHGDDFMKAPAASIRVLSFQVGLELESFGTHRWGDPGDGYQNGDL